VCMQSRAAHLPPPCSIPRQYYKYSIRVVFGNYYLKWQM